MELLYLWIEDFRKIKQQGFTFNNKFILENRVEPDGYRLSISLNKSYVDIFPSQLLTVTGVVGRNGAGKSSLMHCLKMLYGQLPRLTSPLFFCFLDTQQKTIFTYYYSDGGLSNMHALHVSVNADQEVKRLYAVKRALKYTLTTWAGDGGKINGFEYPFVDTTCAYLSANFDSHREDIYRGIENQSTNARMEAFLKEYIPQQEKIAVRQSQNKNQDRINDPYPSYLKDFYKTELKSNVRFITYADKHQTSNLPELPADITIKFNFNDFQYLTNTDVRNISFRYAEKLIEIHSLALELLLNGRSKKEAFFDLLYLCTFYYAIRNKLFDFNSFTKGDLDGMLNMILREPKDIYNAIRKTLDELNLSPENEKERRLIRGILGRGFNTALKNATLLPEPTVEVSPTSFSFKVDTHLWDLLGRIFDITYGDEINFMDYSWGNGLSTGEEALLTHFSRLYEIKRKIGRQNLVLLIDEGDLYFHPQWQKNYIHYLMEGISFIFHNNKVQLVLSTHSPFIVSDLPKQNLIFLKKNSIGHCVVSPNEIHTETFAANIHELFTNSFFLADGLMGEYARKYLNDLIEDIKMEDNISLERYEFYYKNRIAIIGEQFLKSKIIELIAQRSDFFAIDQIFEQRSSELDYLRNLRNKKRNDSDRA
ncbi:AAA family ATPase [Mucilaginibacter sp. OK283]|uniref:AAA family ATPase n=1 Tax=Mucilaginibacter sp. OK283 TaxID=1881049 RepID=UPI0008D697C4|nr:AAA family ATPase [Mucilaginibacter sp. OK283]SEO81037.1 AAA ATPase domain-containing protein [Mucilaginibacter sp. OK283]